MLLMQETSHSYKLRPASAPRRLKDAMRCIALQLRRFRLPQILHAARVHAARANATIDLMRAKIEQTARGAKTFSGRTVGRVSNERLRQGLQEVRAVCLRGAVEHLRPRLEPAQGQALPPCHWLLHRGVLKQGPLRVTLFKH